jgi:hypothetical protein
VKFDSPAAQDNPGFFLYTLFCVPLNSGGSGLSCKGSCYFACLASGFCLSEVPLADSENIDPNFSALPVTFADEAAC